MASRCSGEPEEDAAAVRLAEIFAIDTRALCLLMPLSAVVDREIELFVAGLKSAEHEEAIRAFFDKRAPDFAPRV